MFKRYFLFLGVFFKSYGCLNHQEISISNFQYHKMINEYSKNFLILHNIMFQKNDEIFQIFKKSNDIEKILLIKKYHLDISLELIIQDIILIIDHFILYIDFYFPSGFSKNSNVLLKNICKNYYIDNFFKNNIMASFPKKINNRNNNKNNLVDDNFIKIFTHRSEPEKTQEKNDTNKNNLIIENDNDFIKPTHFVTTIPSDEFYSKRNQESFIHNDNFKDKTIKTQRKRAVPKPYLTIQKSQKFFNGGSLNKSGITVYTDPDFKRTDLKSQNLMEVMAIDSALKQSNPSSKKETEEFPLDSLSKQWCVAYNSNGNQIFESPFFNSYKATEPSDKLIIKSHEKSIENQEPSHLNNNSKSQTLLQQYLQKNFDINDETLNENFQIATNEILDEYPDSTILNTYSSKSYTQESNDNINNQILSNEIVYPADNNINDHDEILLNQEMSMDDLALIQNALNKFQDKNISNDFSICSGLDNNISKKIPDYFINSMNTNNLYNIDNINQNKLIEELTNLIIEHLTNLVITDLTNVTMEHLIKNNTNTLQSIPEELEEIIDEDTPEEIIDEDSQEDNNNIQIPKKAIINVQSTSSIINSSNNFHISLEQYNDHKSSHQSNKSHNTPLNESHNSSTKKPIVEENSLNLLDKSFGNNKSLIHHQSNKSHNTPLNESYNSSIKKPIVEENSLNLLDKSFGNNKSLIHHQSHQSNKSHNTPLNESYNSSTKKVIVEENSLNLLDKSFGNNKSLIHHQSHQSNKSHNLKFIEQNNISLDKSFSIDFKDYNPDINSINNENEKYQQIFFNYSDQTFSKETHNNHNSFNLEE